MNKSASAGLIIVGLVLYFGVFKTMPNPGLFLDSHALILVCGGTLAAALISLPFSRIQELCDLFVFGFFLKRKRQDLTHAKEVIQAAVIANQVGIHEINMVPTHPFFREALMVIKKDQLSVSDIHAVLSKRSEYFKRLYSADAKALNNLGKFPPAFGLLGATTGMISMMTNLGGGTAQIGPAMAIALVATFWGIAVANFIILPLADYASRVVEEDQALRQIIIDGCLMIKQQVPAEVLGERLASHLPPYQRRELLAGLSSLISSTVVSFSGENKKLRKAV